MKITITGSLGNVGKPLTEKLLKKSNTLTVISSNPKKKADIEALGAAAAIGSLQDPDFLLSAFEGADAVFLMVPPNFAATDPRGYYRSVGSNYLSWVRLSAGLIFNG
ncbi:NAD(P)H-binding protein [Desertivirga xinjiangensis]|uniref:NAD(P)H-binding protein n=1 Tax=Desertivirga xinjiangensis TaxID=539206 RepID=UPI00210C75D7|nr:NAD(P)H-binding protein [Pedobacter xinjiangensis]